MSEYDAAIRALRRVLRGRRNLLKICGSGMTIEGEKNAKAEIISIKSAIKRLEEEINVV